jgi:hypothetical protein
MLFAAPVSAGREQTREAGEGRGRTGVQGARGDAGRGVVEVIRPNQIPHELQHGVHLRLHQVCRVRVRVRSLVCFVPSFRGGGVRCDVNVRSLVMPTTGTPSLLMASSRSVMLAIFRNL